MPEFPVRDIGRMGIVTDSKPYSLPFQVFSDGRNVRFTNGHISRHSVFKKLKKPTVMPPNPVGVIDASSIGETGYLATIHKDGTVWEHLTGGLTDVTPVEGPLTVSKPQITGGTLGGVVYAHCNDGAPIYRYQPLDGEFQYIPNWDANESCEVLRTYKDYLIALNVTKGNDSYKNMIKWSDAAQAGTPPANWDTASLTSHAGENILNNATGELVDGLELGSTFVLYGSKETHALDFIGLPLVFSTRTLFADLALMAPNCAVAVDAAHYVFAPNDIVIHDGVSKQSIVDKKVRSRIFNSLDFSKRERCYTFRSKDRSEIYFCYPSIKSGTAWSHSDVDGCNEAAVYDYSEGTWTFIDLPSVKSALSISIADVVTFADMNASWASQSSSWSSFEGQSPEFTLVIGSGNPAQGKAPDMYFMDELHVGRLSNMTDEDLLWEGYVEATNRDLDELGANLGVTKAISMLAPQVATIGGSGTIRVQVGASQSPISTVTWTDAIPFNPATEYKVNYRVNGRYLSYRFEIPADTFCELSGFDVAVDAIAGR